MYLRLTCFLAIQPPNRFLPPLVPLSFPSSPCPSPVSHFLFTICCHSLPLRFHFAPFSDSCPSSPALLLLLQLALVLSRLPSLPVSSQSLRFRLPCLPISVSVSLSTVSMYVCSGVYLRCASPEALSAVLAALFTDRQTANTEPGRAGQDHRR